MPEHLHEGEMAGEENLPDTRIRKRWAVHKQVAKFDLPSMSYLDENILEFFDGE
jgi:hypothetical protein